MRALALLSPFIPVLLVLAACGSPPKPPSVDASKRHPVNASEAVELQVCKNDLQNTRILAVESGRIAQSSTATLANLAARQQALAMMQGQAGASTSSNGVYTVRFGFGSARVDLPGPAAQLLVDRAKMSPLILLRGRTDGASDDPAESRMARERANAVRDYLVAAGIDAARIRATYQPAGDTVADNGSASGRSLNRRVEIELYRSLPVSLNQAFAAP